MTSSAPSSFEGRPKEEGDVADTTTTTTCDHGDEALKWEDFFGKICCNKGPKENETWRDMRVGMIDKNSSFFFFNIIPLPHLFSHDILEIVIINIL